MTTLTQNQGERYADLSALAAEVWRLQDTKVDDVVDTRRMSFTSTDDNVSVLSWDSPDGSTLAGPVGEYAHRQISERLAIPKRYYDRMRTAAPELLDRNVQHWFLMDPETRMVRMLDGRVRAFLSNRYRRLDHVDLLENAVIPSLMGVEGLMFQVAALTDERLTIRALLPGLERAVKVGDPVQAGVEIRNSEIGAGALVVNPFIWRLVCRNGMVANDRSLNRYHVGRAQEETAYEIYRDDTLEADDRAFFLKVRDAITAALDEVTFDQIVAEMRAAAEGTPIANPVAATERLAQRFNLTQDEHETVLGYLAAGGDLSQWGAVNALTAAAKHADTFDRQHDLETAGGVLVGVPAEEWAALAA